MSFSKTVPQMRARTKTVTRRSVHTWKGLSVGDELTAIEKGQGLAKGQQQVVLGRIRVTSVRVEDLWDITQTDVELEGLPDLPRQDFIVMFCKMNGGLSGQEVRRIEFAHLEE